MKTQEELRTFYDSSIVPELEYLEHLRKEQLKRIRFMWVAGILSVALGLASMLPFLILVFLFASLGIYFAAFGFKRQRPDFKSEYKRIVISNVMKFVSPTLEFMPQQFINKATYDQSGIFLTNPDIYNGEDLVTGTIEKTKVEFCELHTQDRQTDSKGNTRYVTIFKGLFFIADFHKHFHGQTYVLSDFGERFLGLFGKMLQGMSIGRPDVVRLEDPEFEKYYVVYSSDEVEARYILSTTFMQRIVEFRKEHDSKIQFSFIGSNIYMAIPMKRNLFEPSLRKTVMNFADVENYYDQILFCTGIVDDMNLNTRIWSKI